MEEWTGPINYIVHHDEGGDKAEEVGQLAPSNSVERFHHERDDEGSDGNEGGWKFQGQLYASFGRG